MNPFYIVNSLNSINRVFMFANNWFAYYRYGRDTFNTEYLADTLSSIIEQNNFVETLVPLHVSGNGNRLAYAVSRALVGREIFWHPLTVCLRRSLIEDKQKYSNILGDFFTKDDWNEIINQCDMDYSWPSDNLGEWHFVHYK